MVLKRLRQRHSIVRTFFAPHDPDKDELVQAGFEGLADALRYFDPSKRKFSTYAVPIIEQRIWNAVNRRAEQVKESPGALPRAYHFTPTELKGERQWAKDCRGLSGRDAHRYGEISKKSLTAGKTKL